MLDELRRLLAYHHWANRALRAVAEALPPEAAQRELGGSFRSLRATLEHMLWAEWLWLERFHGRSPRTVPADVDFSTLAAMAPIWDEVERGQRAFVDGLMDADLARPLSYTNLAGIASTFPLAEVLRHLVNHGTYHRGQVAFMLRMLGATPPSTDYVRFLDA